MRGNGRQCCTPGRAFELFRQGWTLPVSAAVAAATAMEATAAMEPTTSTVEATSASSEAAATVEATRTAAESVAISETTAPGEAATAGEATTAVEAAAAIESTAAIVPVEPRAGADKDAAVEPIGTVVAVRRARVWVVSIVAIGAHWSRAIVARTESNAERNPLCMCGRYRNQANATYSHKSQKP